MCKNYLAPTSASLGDGPSLIEPYEDVNSVRKMAEAVNDMKMKVIDRFEELINNSGSFFVSIEEEEKKEILKYKDIIIALLDKITSKILAGKIKPWRTAQYESKRNGNAYNDPQKGSANIALFPGTFDPPHLGHLMTALTHLAEDNTDSDFLIVLPNSNQEIFGDPSKPYKNSHSWRWYITKVMFEDFFPLVRVSKDGEHTTPLTYIRELLIRNQFKNVKITNVIGSDILKRIFPILLRGTQYWKGDKLAESFQFHLNVIERSGTELNSETIRQKITILNERGIHVVETRSEYDDYLSSTDFKNTGEFNLFYPASIPSGTGLQWLMRYKYHGTPYKFRKEVLEVLDKKGLMTHETYISLSKSIIGLMEDTVTSEIGKQHLNGLLLHLNSDLAHHPDTLALITALISTPQIATESMSKKYLSQIGKSS